jgi:hypothetical protein
MVVPLCQDSSLFTFHWSCTLFSLVLLFLVLGLWCVRFQFVKLVIPSGDLVVKTLVCFAIKSKGLLAFSLKKRN